MNRIIAAVTLSFLVNASHAQHNLPAMHLDRPIISEWVCTRCSSAAEIPYLFGGNVYLDNPSARSHTFPVVGAQFNAHTLGGTNQLAFGIATEAWAHPDSLSSLIGNESTAINLNPSNPSKKISYLATFKNRSDREYSTGSHLPAANEESAALRVESQPGTGFESVIVLSPESVRGTQNNRAALINLREVSMQKVVQMDLIAFPDGCALRYVGFGATTVICH